MSVQRKDVPILLIVLGVLLAVISWQFIYNPNVEKTKWYEEDNEALQTSVMELENLEAHMDEYTAEMETMRAEVEEIVAQYPKGFITEEELMYYYNMEGVRQNQVVIPNIGFGAPVEFPYSGNLNMGDYQLYDEGYKFETAQNNLSFTTTYNGLKNLIHYVYEMPGRKSISSISLTAATDGYLNGTMNMEFYSLHGPEDVYEPEAVNGVATGKSNIFGILDGRTNDATEDTAEDTTEEE